MVMMKYREGGYGPERAIGPFDGPSHCARLPIMAQSPCLWTDGDRHLPCDSRIYDKPNDQKTKNDHFGDLLRAAQNRGFSPECVLLDGWYSSLDNLKHLRTIGWHWLTRLKSNRWVNPDRTGLRAVSACEILATGTVVHFEGYGLINVFRIVAKDGTTERWATSD